MTIDTPAANKNDTGIDGLYTEFFKYKHLEKWWINISEYWKTKKAFFAENTKKSCKNMTQQCNLSELVLEPKM